MFSQAVLSDFLTQADIKVFGCIYSAASMFFAHPGCSYTLTEYIEISSGR